MAVPPGLWRDDLWRDREPSGDYSTRLLQRTPRTSPHPRHHAHHGSVAARESEASHVLVRSGRWMTSSCERSKEAAPLGSDRLFLPPALHHGCPLPPVVALRRGKAHRVSPRCPLRTVIMQVCHRSAGASSFGDSLWVARTSSPFEDCGTPGNAPPLFQVWRHCVFMCGPTSSTCLTLELGSKG
jgi:hypothetical protein